MKATLCAGLLFLVGWAAAQEFRGGVLGRITDSTGAVIVGAAIRVTNTETNVAASTVSNQDGNYQIPAVSGYKSNKFNWLENSKDFSPLSCI
jgi:hypothetical protein